MDTGIIKLALNKIIDDAKANKDATPDVLWNKHRAEVVLQEMSTKVTMDDVMKTGGEWLGVARSWIQFHFINGSDVTWGSQDLLRGHDVRVCDIEQLAAKIAVTAMNEHILKS